MSKFTSKLSNAFSIWEGNTPTTFKNDNNSQKGGENSTSIREPLLSSFYEEPRTFLNIDDEEEVKRSKERALALME